MTAEEFVGRILTARFVPKGRSYDAVDCWGLVFLYYRDVLGTPVGSYAGDYSEEEVSRARGLEGLMMAHAHLWRPADDRQAGDVALFRIAGRAVHVGVLVDPGRVLHAEERVGVIVERLDSSAWARRLEGVYRLAAG